MDKKYRKLLRLILKAVALAMGSVLFVTNIFGVLDQKTAVSLTAIALLCLALDALQGDSK